MSDSLCPKTRKKCKESKYMKLCIHILVKDTIILIQPHEHETLFREKHKCPSEYIDFMMISCNEFISSFFNGMHTLIVSKEKNKVTGDDLIIPLLRYCSSYIINNFIPNCPEAVGFFRKIYKEVQNLDPPVSKEHAMNGIRTLFMTKFIGPLIVTQNKFHSKFIKEFLKERSECIIKMSNTIKYLFLDNKETIDTKVQNNFCSRKVSAYTVQNVIDEYQPKVSSWYKNLLCENQIVI